jgi:hypothetical protein
VESVGSGDRSAGMCLRRGVCRRFSGWIERIEEDLVVIADVLRPLSPFATYHSGITGLEASPWEFRPGTFVGYRLNSEKEIIALWLLEDDGR